MQEDREPRCEHAKGLMDKFETTVAVVEGDESAGVAEATRKPKARSAPEWEPEARNRLKAAIRRYSKRLLHQRRPVQRPTEAINLLIQRIKRVGFGFRNFGNYQLQLLLPLRRRLAHCRRRPHQRPRTTLRGIEPSWLF